MNLLIDPTALGMVYYHRSQTVRGQTRSYYLGEPPYLALIVVFDSTINDLSRAVVNAKVGYEPGFEGFCVQGYEGRRHTKITIEHIVSEPDEYEQTLTDVLREAYTEGISTYVSIHYWQNDDQWIGYLEDDSSYWSAAPTVVELKNQLRQFAYLRETTPPPTNPLTEVPANTQRGQLALATRGGR